MIDINWGESGLIPAVAQDFKTGQILMQAYMNKEALEKCLETGLAAYYSRSRKGLWVKGETSGHFQKIKKIVTDCDGDCILLLVEQIGVACHTGAPSCFFNEVKTFEPVPDYKIIFKVNDVICERKNNPVDGSYTNYLLGKGTEKICKKIGEEATETVIAAVAGKREELVGELADLFYHSAVLMACEGVKIEEVFAELERREGRPPEQKASRKQ